MKKLFVLSSFVAIVAIVAACGSNENADNTSTTAIDETSDVAKYDPNRGEGKFTKVELGASLDATKAETGKKIFEVKCGSCHKLTDERLVGPGWAGVTTRNTPEWIMNFITNPDPMLDKDPEAQAMLELCLVRMPNQNLTDDEARNILEFMRKIDGVN